MKTKIRLTESQLMSLIKRIVEEEKYSEEDLTFYNETYGKDCMIRVAKRKIIKNYETRKTLLKF